MGFLVKVASHMAPLHDSRNSIPSSPLYIGRSRFEISIPLPDGGAFASHQVKRAVMGLNSGPSIVQTLYVKESTSKYE